MGEMQGTERQRKQALEWTDTEGRRQKTGRDTQGREKRNQRERETVGEAASETGRQRETEDKRAEDDAERGGRGACGAGGQALLNRRSVLQTALRGFLRGRGKVVGECAPSRHVDGN